MFQLFALHAWVVAFPTCKGIIKLKVIYETLKFRSYVHLPSTNKMFQYRYYIVIIFEHGCYISALAHYKDVNINEYNL